MYRIFLLHFTLVILSWVLHVLNSSCVKSYFPLKSVESCRGAVERVVFFLQLASSLAKLGLEVHCPWGTFRPAEGGRVHNQISAPGAGASEDRRDTPRAP